jgi:hypothetical protein
MMSNRKNTIHSPCRIDRADPTMVVAARPRGNEEYIGRLLLEAIAESDTCGCRRLFRRRSHGDRVGLH